LTGRFEPGHLHRPGSLPIAQEGVQVQARQVHVRRLGGGIESAEMALPNHPDVAYAFVKTLKDCGYQWVLVQEHSVEQLDNGWHRRRPHLPHRLVCASLGSPRVDPRG